LHLVEMHLPVAKAMSGTLSHPARDASLAGCGYEVVGRIAVLLEGMGGVGGTCPLPFQRWRGVFYFDRLRSQNLVCECRTHCKTPRLLRIHPSKRGEYYGI